MLIRLKHDDSNDSIGEVALISAEDGFWIPGNLVVLRKPFIPGNLPSSSLKKTTDTLSCYTHGIIVRVSADDAIVCAPYNPRTQIYYTTPSSPFHGHPLFLVGWKSHFLPYQDLRCNILNYVPPRHDWYEIYHPNTQTRSWHLVCNIVDAPDGFLYGVAVVEEESSEPQVLPVHCAGVSSHGWSFSL